MWVFLVGGVIAVFNMRQEVFPTAILDTIEIRAEYRGATAAQVEAQVVQPMEQSIDTLRDIRTIVSEIRSGGANIFVMLDDGADSQRALDEIRSAIDGLSSLPADLEPTTIIQMREDDEDIEVGFYGFQSREELHAFSELARERLLNLPAVGQVQVDGAGEPEISVRVSPIERVCLVSRCVKSLIAFGVHRSNSLVESFEAQRGSMVWLQALIGVMPTNSETLRLWNRRLACP
jgi:multidrug efflux pump subunit AcrB